ncbi:hypothetical protein CH063_11416, partial [Colletotrichum higginsianum]
NGLVVVIREWPRGAFFGLIIIVDGTVVIALAESHSPSGLLSRAAAHYPGLENACRRSGVCCHHTMTGCERDAGYGCGRWCREGDVGGCELTREEVTRKHEYLVG